MKYLWTFALLHVLAVLTAGLTVGSSLHCAVRREISPCTCKHHEERPGSIQVTCERMTSFMQVVTALKDRFEEDVTISLTISYSQLEDLPLLSFLKLGLNVETLKLNHDDLSGLPDTVFLGLGRTEFLSLADNSLPVVPHHILRLMPIIKTLDMSRCKITTLRGRDFQNLPLLRILLLASNAVSRMDNNTFPESLTKLHLARNSLTTLNGTLRNLAGLEWLFINENDLSSLDGELPEMIPNSKLALLDVSYNRLERLPQELRHFQALNVLFAHDNQITALNGALSKNRRLERLHLDKNNLTTLAPDDFAEVEALEFLKLSYNQLTSLNSSLLPLRSLRLLNLTHNYLEEFSLQDIRGLRHLTIVDISHNKISRLGGRMENLVELETRVIELRLDHNRLEDLGGALMGLNSLQRLNLSHNRLTHISPDDLIGLDNLKILDVSFNLLTTLEETSKTFLPSLEELIATNNQLIALERDFHGLPVLCWADLSYNHIRLISKELVEKTQCQLHGVNRTLNIYLNENPVLCDDNMMATIKVMEEKNTTKVFGKVDCVVEVNNTVPMAMPMMPLAV
ncbi:leucine-rich repeat-containing protein 1 [Macrosteles quadrilineatus]|uniref:leucine-rich repeat-containing protein 1 n=1 Tax=Macrosteles quadrilineatus TaxID=74068 RepID=UPI0023E1B5BE|nr:leucine-rich repeat-containing protein 1 [Macrosteles quadrilineatus]